jgi:hypothetical protein
MFALRPLFFGRQDNFSGSTREFINDLRVALIIAVKCKAKWPQSPCSSIHFILGKKGVYIL